MGMEMGRVGNLKGMLEPAVLAELLDAANGLAYEISLRDVLV
jgi:hypothetical protein